MRMKTAALGSASAAAILWALSVPAGATCDGSDDQYTCTGNSTNQTIQLNGGSNQSTGETWGGTVFNFGTTTGTVTGSAYGDVIVNGSTLATLQDLAAAEEGPTDAAFAAALAEDGSATTKYSLSGTATLGGGDDTFVNFGTVLAGSSLDMGAGGDDFAIANSATFTGNADLGDDGDMAAIFGTMTGTLSLGAGDDLLFVGARGATTSEHTALVNALTSEMRDEATDSDDPVAKWFLAGPDVQDPAVITGLINGGAGADDILNLGTITAAAGTAIDFGTGQAFLANAGTITGAVDASQASSDQGNAAAEIVNIGTITGAVTLGGTQEGSLQNMSVLPGLYDALLAEDTEDLSKDPMVDLMFREPDSTATSGTITGNITAGTGWTNIFNQGRITGNVDLSPVGSGLNWQEMPQALLVNSNLVTGSVTGGNDTSQDEVFNLGTIGVSGTTNNTNMVSLGNGNNLFVNGLRTDQFKNAFVSAMSSDDNSQEGPTAIRELLNQDIDTTKGGTLYGNYVGGAGNDNVGNFGTIHGSVTMGAGDDWVGNAGVINGAVDLGDGDDIYILGLGSRVTSVAGGIGTDTLSIGGTDADTVYINLASFTGFETFTGATFEDIGNLTASGTAEVDKPVFGDLTLNAGANNLTLKEGAALGGNLAGDGGGDDELTLEGDGTIGGDVSNFKTLKVAGTGTDAATKKWNLNGSVTVEEVDVETGQLAFNGSVNATTGVTVRSGGGLAGSGTITGSVSNAGFLRPGNSVGTLTVNGNYTQSGTYEVEVNPKNAVGSQADKLVVNGAGNTLTIASGARVSVVPEDSKTFVVGDFTFDGNNQVSYTIAEATGGATISGTFGSVSDDFAFLTAELAHTTTAVTLTLTKAASFGNEALDSVTDAAAQTYLLGLSTAEADTLLDSPKAVAGATSAAATASSGQLVGSVGRGMASGRAATGAGLNTGDAVFREGSVWMTGLGAMGEVDGDASAPGYDTTTWGLTTGVDGELSDEIVLGVALGYAATSVDSTAGGGADVDSYQAGVYGTWTPGRSWLEGSLSFIRHAYDTTRVLPNQGNATASFNGNEVAAHVGAGHVYDMGTWQIEPRVGLDLSSLRREAYTESSPVAALAMTAGDDTFNTGRVTAGIQTAYPYTSEGGWAVRPTARLGVGQRFGDTDGAYTMQYVGGTTATSVRGPDVGNTSALFGLGLSTKGPTGTALSMDYDGEWNQDQINHQFTAGVSFTW